MTGGPVRTCLGCRQATALAEGRLVRIARNPDGSLGVGRRLPGRGAWVCRDDHRCHDRVLRPKVLTWALRAEIGPEAVDQLRSGFPALAADARD